MDMLSARLNVQPVLCWGLTLPRTAVLPRWVFPYCVVTVAVYFLLLFGITEARQLIKEFILAPGSESPRA